MTTLTQPSLFTASSPISPRVIVNIRDAVGGELVQMERIETNGDWFTIRQVLIRSHCNNARGRAETLASAWCDDLESNPGQFVTMTYDVAYNDQLTRQWNEAAP